MAKTDFIKQFIDTTIDSSDGIHAVSVVEIASGMSLGAFSDGVLDPDVASAYNVEVVKSKLKAIAALGLKEGIDDILITLETQYHIINCTKKGTHMVYVAADKKKANLALLRAVVNKGVKEIEEKI
ncbi:MAG: hypothetical protein CMB80_15845 [Flammeovirgaceae bacterium]|nr:hypothetical protein [Flammeovirgaceae bacterium]MBR10115.1 hypothetical protein [Rickettsiales bacterium]|tara:strand:+ start:358 stop:735 length:378 start_codon:yes stop_codon:yes gene_type:complete